MVGPTTLQNINKRIVDFEYAVRGRQAIVAESLEARLAQGEKLPFRHVTACNIGNPQQLGQRPITFIRQVAACMECPELRSRDLFPPDVVARYTFPHSKDFYYIYRSGELLQACGSIGAYSNSQGIPLIRHRVAAFIGVLNIIKVVF